LSFSYTYIALQLSFDTNWLQQGGVTMIISGSSAYSQIIL